MNLYIGKEKETLYDIAQKYNLTFEELVQFNKSYRFKMDLKDCPVLIPTKEKRVINMPNSYDKKFFYDVFECKIESILYKIKTEPNIKIFKNFLINLKIKIL